MPPPENDNIGRSRKLNKPDVVANHYGSDISEIGRDSMLKRRSSPSVRSGSNRSRSHSRVSNGTMMQVKRKLSNTSVTGPRRKMKRSDSEKKKVMEKKLLSYYQSLVKDCNDYSPPCLGSEQMLDGTDVDM